MRILSLGLAAEIEEEILQAPVLFHSVWSHRALAAQAQLREALKIGEPPVIVAGHGLPGTGPMDVLRLVQSIAPSASFIGIARSGSEARELLEAGALDAFPSDQIWRLPSALAHAFKAVERRLADRKAAGMDVLLEAVKRLSMARRMEDIVEIVRHAARRLSQADGATFVLRDGDLCHYVDEDAIGPLWRGLRFPMANCISGWSMLHRMPAVVPDIYADARIPVDAYRPTFVKSLVMMPIRSEAPIGAIGTYWARSREVGADELELIQALADSTALAVENVRFLSDLERRVTERTASLEGANRELEAFSYSVSHDLRSPLTVIRGYSELMLSDPRTVLPVRERQMVEDIRLSADRMHELIEDLLRLSRVTGREVEFHPVDLSSLTGEILRELALREPDRKVEVRVEGGLMARADEGLVRIALENLLSNAWKYSSTRPAARIEVGSSGRPDPVRTFFVRDNGVGFDMEKAGRLFEPFQRLHSVNEFQGTGIGLATVSRVLQKHGCKVWAESEKEKGSTFYFTLPASAGYLADDG